MAVDKLVDSEQLNSDLTSVANAIRTKGGASGSLAFPADFITAIGNIPVGSNVPLVSGTFKGSSAEKGSAKTLTLDYSGDGYPVFILIYPSVGIYKSGSDIYNLVQNKAIVVSCRIKADISAAPDYSGSAEKNLGSYFNFYKNSSSVSTYYETAGAPNGTMYTEAAAGNTNGTVVRINSKTSVSVYIADASYGFADGIEYTYHVMYSR